MATEDLKSHALNSSQDFYSLLEVNEGASESEIRRAYRKTALKYHPDKVGANQEALDKFHVLQIAYDVLSDPAIKELYDNARRAKQAKTERDRAYEGRRKWMKEDLERRESGAFKRKREEVDAEEEFERELRRLAEDGKKRRKEREETLRKEAEEVRGRGENGVDSGEVVEEKTNATGEVPEMDRSVTLRYPHNSETQDIGKSEVTNRFERFGQIEDVVLREKKIKAEGEKHRRSYMTAVLVYKSIVGAHAAVTDFPKLSVSLPGTFGIFEAVDWAAGQQPSSLPTYTPTSAPQTPASKARPRAEDLLNGRAAPVTPVQNGGAGAGLKKVPSFGSFKGTPMSAAKAQNSPSLDEITMIRLKNAERRRMEERIRKEEAEAAAAEAEGKGNRGL